MDPAEIEAKVREAYELENPEYAKAAEEAAKVLEAHDSAMEEAYAAYQEENPMPNEADYSNPSEYLAAMEEWSAAAKEHMEEQEANYRKENENYDNLMDAVEWENLNDLFPNLKKPPSDEPSIIVRPDPGFQINPSDVDPGIRIEDPGFSRIVDPGIRIEDPGFSRIEDPGFTKILEPEYKDPGFSRIVNPEYTDPGFSKIEDSIYKIDN